MKAINTIRKIAFVGNYPPRKCGIATFTQDVLTAVAGVEPECECFAVSVSDISGAYKYPDVVRFEIAEQDLSSYLRAADFLNDSGADVVCLQHEFGIFGGSAGSHILALLHELRMPVVTTLHTVLQSSTPDQLRVMEGLISLSTRLVVMAERGRQMLRDIYHAPADKIGLVPHGIPDGEFVDPDDLKSRFGVEGKTVLLTFGLLSPNKGIEYVLNALPRILAEFPDVVYIILGATHPNEIREHGEAYRRGLEQLARANGIENSVIFHNQFVDLESLKEHLGAADLYITPYLNEAQITSGTLAYAFGSGKVVVSTPYWHAAELLANGRGVLVPFADSLAMSREIVGLLRDDARRLQMRTKAWQLGRRMVWGSAGRLYLDLFGAARAEAAEVPARMIVPDRFGGRVPAVPGRAGLALQLAAHGLPELNLNHLMEMTDSTGVFQHAVYSVPNFAEGYCVDDNARALILAVALFGAGLEAECSRTVATTAGAFLHHAFNLHTGRFHNFMSFDRHWLDERGSEDSHGRALWGLGTAVGRPTPGGIKMVARQVFGLALPALTSFTSPRAWAFGLLGIDEFLRSTGNDGHADETRELLITRLMHLFGKSTHPDWTWFEAELAYDNAKLPHALIVSGLAMGQADVLACGLDTLRWLAELQTSEDRLFRPIGSNGFHRHRGPRALFDQQPIEAHATVSACLAAWRATGDLEWHQQAQRAFDWFLGCNDLGLELYCRQTGGCRDGLHADRANENQGAESTLAFLLSLAEMQLAGRQLTEMRVAEMQLKLPLTTRLRQEVGVA